MGQPQTLEFMDDDRAVIVGVMGDVAQAGSGWINFQPDVDPDDLPSEERSMFGLFSARGPRVPLCTWSPPGARSKQRYISLGLQHGLGVPAIKYLRELGLDPDPRWRVLQDQPRRGSVVAAPLDDDNDEVLLWLLAAGAALCPARFGGRWLAAVYRRGS